MNRDFVGALLQLNAEKNIPRDQLVATLADAIQSAYRRATPGNENVFVDVDPDSGRFSAYRAMYVVEEVEDPTVEFTLDDAKAYKADAQVGELVEIGKLDSASFGRIHAQLATQLVRQRLREVEREQVFGQYAQRESEIITGTVSRVEPRGVILDVGRAEAILPTTDQSASEHYRIGQHVKAYVLEVRRTTKGPLIYVSRTHKNFLRRLFELEVPEIHGGTVEIKAIAREAGSRSKVAVASRQDGLDPVGATVGQRGGRVQAVVAELGGEKIDIIPWNEDPAVFVANALSPATVVNVAIDEEARIASVTVPERMLSLAIGREGQNARLAAKLTGWRIDIRSDQAPPRPAPTPRESPAQPAGVAEQPAEMAEQPAEMAEQPAEPAQAAAEGSAPKKRVTRAKKTEAAAAEAVPETTAAEEPAPKKRVTRAKKTEAAAAEAVPETTAAEEPAPKKRVARAKKTEAAAAEAVPETTAAEESAPKKRVTRAKKTEAAAAEAVPETTAAEEPAPKKRVTRAKKTEAAAAEPPKAKAESKTSKAAATARRTRKPATVAAKEK